MSVETEAVAEITKILNRCPHLEGVISAFDRVPLTDGHIDVYRGRSVPRRTAEWRGRVNVQLKGRTSKKARSTYSLKREALLAHQVNGGVLLFCVDVDLKSDTNVAQYAVLTPIRIREILKAVPAEQKEVAIKLAKLPRLPDAVERIVDVALAGARQNPFQRVNPQVFELLGTHLLSGVTLQPIKGAVTTSVGSNVCYSGAFSGTAVGATVCYGAPYGCYDNLTLTTNTSGTPAAGSGDSGGPVYITQSTGVHATGYISGVRNYSTACTGEPGVNGRVCSPEVIFASVVDSFYAGYGISYIP